MDNRRARWVLQGYKEEIPSTHTVDSTCLRYWGGQGGGEPRMIFPVLAHSGCYNQVPQTGRLQQQTLISGSCEVQDKTPADPVCGADQLLGPQMAIFPRCVLAWQKDVRESWSLFFVRSLIPFMRAPLS